MRLLYVHAHPDDETLWNGCSIAALVHAGHEVHVLTCTLGEEGEVIPAELKHLELPAGQPRPLDAADPLGQVRREELRCATQRLGVASATVLGEHGGRSWRDSGMAGTPAARHPRAFAAAPVSQVAAAIAAQLERIVPEVVVTYEQHGGYGHPDHIQTHRGVVAAVREVHPHPLLLATVTPRQWYEQDLAWLQQELAGQADPTPPGPQDPALQSVYPDDLPSYEVIAPQTIPLVEHAAAAHATQVRVRPGMFVLSNGVATRISGREAFAPVDLKTGELCHGGGVRAALGQV